MLDINELSLMAASIKPNNDLPVEERLTDALNQAYDGPIRELCYNNSADFFGRAALAAVMAKAPPEDRARLDQDMKGLKILQALTQGVPVDFESALADQETAPKPVGVSAIIRKWADAKGIK